MHMRTTHPHPRRAAENGDAPKRRSSEGAVARVKKNRTVLPFHNVIQLPTVNA